VQIVGGKYTTYRVMAADVVDAAAAELGREVPESRTADIPLVGAVGFAADWAQRVSIAADYGVSEEAVTSLMRRHGSRATDVLALVADAPDLAAPLVAGTPYLRAEVVHAATDEAALTVDDVLRRRTRVALETRDQARSAAHDAARLMAQPLGWSESQADEAAESYLASPDALALVTIAD
jgi:glycerol-3-phosphate dehydrogenase